MQQKPITLCVDRQKNIERTKPPSFANPTRCKMINMKRWFTQLTFMNAIKSKKEAWRERTRLQNKNQDLPFIGVVLPCSSTPRMNHYSLTTDFEVLHCYLFYFIFIFLLHCYHSTMCRVGVISQKMTRQQKTKYFRRCFPRERVRV